jgi:hypothetical protein
MPPAEIRMMRLRVIQSMTMMMTKQVSSSVNALENILSANPLFFSFGLSFIREERFLEKEQVCEPASSHGFSFFFFLSLFFQENKNPGNGTVVNMCDASF